MDNFKYRMKSQLDDISKLTPMPVAPVLAVVKKYIIGYFVVQFNRVSRTESLLLGISCPKETLIDKLLIVCLFGKIRI